MDAKNTCSILHGRHDKFCQVCIVKLRIMKSWKTIKTPTKITINDGS